MGCKHSKTLQGVAGRGDDDMSAADMEAVRRLSGVSGNLELHQDEDEGVQECIEEAGKARFGGVARRDSIRINKIAIEKRKKNIAGEGGKVREGMKRPLPRAFMKPGEKNSCPPKGGKFGKIVRRDSIRVNKEKIDRKKKHRESKSNSAGLPAGMKVEVVPPTPPYGEQSIKSVKHMANPAHE